MTVTFFVPGAPQPGGSKKGYAVKTKGGGTRIAIVEDAKHNAPWRAKVSLAAADLFQDGPLAGPLEVSFSFQMPRPLSHYGTGKNRGTLKVTAPDWHTIAPDTTKLIRSTEDALKGIAWVDDAQVAHQVGSKTYANDRRPGCWITISRLPPSPRSAGIVTWEPTVRNDEETAPPADQPALFEERP